jgi:hypothetical protein
MADQRLTGEKLGQDCDAFGGDADTDPLVPVAADDRSIGRDDDEAVEVVLCEQRHEVIAQPGQRRRGDQTVALGGILPPEPFELDHRLSHVIGTGEDRCVGPLVLQPQLERGHVAVEDRRQAVGRAHLDALLERGAHPPSHGQQQQDDHGDEPQTETQQWLEVANAGECLSNLACSHDYAGKLPQRACGQTAGILASRDRRLLA